MTFRYYKHNALPTGIIRKVKYDLYRKITFIDLKECSRLGVWNIMECGLHVP